MCTLNRQFLSLHFTIMRKLAFIYNILLQLSDKITCTSNKYSANQTNPVHWSVSEFQTQQMNFLWPQAPGLNSVSQNRTSDSFSFLWRGQSQKHHTLTPWPLRLQRSQCLYDHHKSTLECPQRLSPRVPMPWWLFHKTKVHKRPPAGSNSQVHQLETFSLQLLLLQQPENNQLQFKIWTPSYSIISKYILSRRIYYFKTKIPFNTFQFWF